MPCPFFYFCSEADVVSKCQEWRKQEAFELWTLCSKKWVDPTLLVGSLDFFYQQGSLSRKFFFNPHIVVKKLHPNPVLQGKVTIFVSAVSARTGWGLRMLGSAHPSSLGMTISNALKDKWHFLNDPYPVIVLLPKNDSWNFEVHTTPQCRAGALVKCSGFIIYIHSNPTVLNLPHYLEVTFAL